MEIITQNSHFKYKRAHFQITESLNANNLGTCREGKKIHDGKAKEAITRDFPATVHVCTMTFFFKPMRHFHIISIMAPLPPRQKWLKSRLAIC